MKRGIKITITIIITLVLLYTLFITEESIRLLNNKSGKPLIILKEKRTDNAIEYKSLGFSLKYKLYYKSEGLVLTNGQEFWLFDTFLIWAWVS